MGSKIKIATININRLKSDIKREKLLKFCKINELDIICFQEMNFKTCPMLESEFSLISNIGINGSGVGLAIKKNIKFDQVVKDGEGRILKCKVAGLNLVNIYAPSGREKREERNAFFQRNITPYLTSLKGPVMVMGDFNSVEHQDDMKIKKHRRNSKIISKHLKEFIQAFQLTDIWLSKGGSKKEHTFFYPKGSSRIDRIYVEQGFDQFIDNVKYLATELSDHLAVAVCITCQEQKPSKISSGWRMNSSILTNPIFINEFTEWWEGINERKIKKNKICEWWDKVFKTGLKRVAIKCSKVIAKNLKEKRLNDQIVLEDIVSKLNEGEDLWEELKTTKKSIKEWEKNIASRNLIKNKSEDKMKGEACTSYHIKTGRANKGINKLEIDGKVEEDENKIKVEFERHFKNIFQREGYKFMGNKFLDVIEKKNLDNKICEPIKEHEIKFVIDRCSKAKAPGHDGITYEFYQLFWPIVKSRMTELFNEIIENEQMAESQSLAMVKLIPKVASPIRPSDFRPISLLCTDYKILSGVLAERLKPLLPEVIHESQKGGVPGRSLFTSLSLFRDVIARMDELNRDHNKKDWPGLSRVNCAFVAIDFEKAYDLVQREFLWKVMEKMGFNLKFVNMIKSLYKACRIKVNLGKNKIIEVEGTNSIRQGCPLSMHLFIIFLEPLIKTIDLKIAGFKHGGKRAAARAFVDDLNVIVTDENDLHVLNEILNDFCTVSGAICNKRKSCIMGLGGWEGRVQWPINEVQSKKEMKLLGITFHTGLSRTINENWKEKMKNMTGQLARNATRRLTIHQRVNFIKEFILPQALHVAKILKCPEKVAERIKVSMQRFIWYGKLERPAPGIQLAPENEGGLAFINPENFFAAALTKTVIDILEDDRGLENELLTYWMQIQLKEAISSTRMNAPRAFDMPEHLKVPAMKIKEWHKKTKKKISSRISTKEIYLMWADANKRKSKLEMRRPRLIDWKRAWRNYQKMAPDEKEIVFMLNHDILPNMVRLHRMKMTTSPLCRLCKRSKETNVHLFLMCTKKKRRIEVFKTKTNQSGMKAIRGDFIGAKDGKTIGKYLKKTWKTRKKEVGAMGGRDKGKY